MNELSDDFDLRISVLMMCAGESAYNILCADKFEDMDFDDWFEEEVKYCNQAVVDLCREALESEAFLTLTRQEQFEIQKVVEVAASLSRLTN